jgi:hypothetical protein
MALRDASVYFNAKIPQGTKLAVIAIKSDYPALSEYIIDGMLENLVNTGKFTIVDRQQLEAVRAELKFQMSGDVDDNSVQEIGRITGAQSIVLGSASPIGNMWRISIRVLTVTNAEMLGIFNKNIPNAGIIKEFEFTPKASAAPIPQTAPVANTPPAPAIPPTPPPQERKVPTQSVPNDGGESSGHYVLVDNRDGKRYRVIKIGNQTWMAEDLNYKTTDGKYKGGSIPQNLCPSGWRLPFDKDWSTLQANSFPDDITAFSRNSSGPWWSAGSPRLPYFQRSNRIRGGSWTPSSVGYNICNVRCIKE